MGEKPSITLACRNYDGTGAIMRGIVKVPGIDLEIVECEDVVDMFARMYKGEFDVSEMSLAELIYYTSRGRSEFVGIPVFPSRIFRHGFIFCRKDSAINRPEDLRDKKIGFVRWVQTATTWVYGTLKDEYGVKPQDETWHIASMHHWDDVDPGGGVAPRDGSILKWIEAPGKNPAERACRALFEGRLDVLGITEGQISLLLGNSEVRRLFENYREVEAAYYRKTKILPIMHVMVIRKSVVETFPELPINLFRSFCEAKARARRWHRTIPSIMQAWTNHYLDEERKIFELDPWAYGLEKNRHVIDRFLIYCRHAGISERNISAEELFHPSTWALEEQL